MLLATIAFQLAAADPNLAGLCNYAKVIGREPAPVFWGWNGRRVKSPPLKPGTVIYTCDERGDRFQISFNASNHHCPPDRTTGLEAHTARSCATAWIDKRRVEVLSG